MAQGKEQKTSATVSSIHTDYVRAQQHLVERRKAQKVRLYRRLAVFAVAAVIILSVLTFKSFNQKQLIALKEKEKTALLVQLEEVEDEQKMLTKQITKLNDDDYIAKLARHEYFLSDKNEIIFSLPKKNDSDKKKAAEKE